MTPQTLDIGDLFFVLPPHADEPSRFVSNEIRDVLKKEPKM